MDNLPVAATAAPATPAVAKTADASAESDASQWVAALQAAVTQQVKDGMPATQGVAAPEPAIVGATATPAATSAPAACVSATAATATNATGEDQTPAWLAALQATLAQNDRGIIKPRPHADGGDNLPGKDDAATDSAEKKPVDSAATAVPPAPLVAILPPPATTTPAAALAAAAVSPTATRVGAAADSGAGTTGVTTRAGRADTDSSPGKADVEIRTATQTPVAGAAGSPKPQPVPADAAAAQDAATRQIESHAIDAATTRDGAGREAGVPPIAQFAHAHTAPAPVVPAATAAQLQINASVGSTAWGAELGQKVVWMIGEKQHVAELHVNPPDLGPLDIKLTVTDNQTTAVFTSPHSAVRDAVETAMPRLREILAESGIQLGNASVTADSPRDGSAFANPQEQAGRGNFGARGLESAPGTAPAPAAQLIRRNGLVDLFA